jgi:xanthine dehydrogenase YagR molybdenum-binding subunit
VRVISPFVGGAFGSGLRAWPDVTIAALAARETSRPVKLVLTRRQLYFGTGFRPAYTYQLRLGSDRSGWLTAMVHDIRGETSSYETFTEEVLAPGQMLYSMPNVRQAYSTVPLDVNTPIWMRGPGMATAVLVVESAMDELANELGIDPIELRVRNEPGNDESTGCRFPPAGLRECYTVGAREFGWQQRNPRPRSTTDGDWLIGTGMAAAVYGAPRMTAQAHVRVNADGTALVQAASDMGPGTYTSMSQVGADALA